MHLILERYSHMGVDQNHVSSQIEQMRLGPVAGERWTLHSVERFIYLIHWYCEIVTIKMMIEAAFQELPQRSRRMIHKRYINRLTFREMADREGRSVSTVRSWTQVAKWGLKKS